MRPIITYGAVAWLSRVALSTMRVAHTKLHRLACACSTGAMRTCSTAAKEVVLELPPLHNVIEQSKKHTPLNLAREGFSKGNPPRLHLHLISEFEKKFSIGLDNKAHWSAPALKMKLYECTLQWYEYADGSRKPDGICAGIYGPKAKCSVPMGSFTASIFQEKVYAICVYVEINLNRISGMSELAFWATARRHSRHCHPVRLRPHWSLSVSRNWIY